MIHLGGAFGGKANDAATSHSNLFSCLIMLVLHNVSGA
jgi:hypothetical protein